jgi:uncharacterized protein YvpB
VTRNRSKARGLSVLIAALCLVWACERDATSQQGATPSVASLQAVGARVIVQKPGQSNYVECVNLRENGSSPPGGNDYSACPLTDALRAKWQATQAHVCPCQQEPSRDRSIIAWPQPGGGEVVISLYSGQVSVDLMVTKVGGNLLVHHTAGKGDVQSRRPAPGAKPAPPPSAAPAPPPPSNESRVLNVPSFLQVFELSCEEAALRMGLAYEGIATTDAAILGLIGVDYRAATFRNGGLTWGDPYSAFVGNPNGSETALTGYGTYHPTIAMAAAQLGGHVLASGEGIAPEDLYSAVLAGHPAVAWVTYQWAVPARQDYVAFDGRTVPYAGPVEHAVTVVGVNPGEVLVNNPLAGPQWIDKSTFEATYWVYNRMAVVLA